MDIRNTRRWRVSLFLGSSHIRPLLPTFLNKAINDGLDDDVFLNIFFYFCENRMTDLMKLCINYTQCKHLFTNDVIGRACRKVISGVIPEILTHKTNIYLLGISVLLETLDTNHIKSIINHENLLVLALIYCPSWEVCAFLIEQGADPYMECTSPFNPSLRVCAIELAKMTCTTSVVSLFENHIKRDSDLFSLLFNSGCCEDEEAIHTSNQKE